MEKIKRGSFLSVAWFASTQTVAKARWVILFLFGIMFLIGIATKQPISFFEILLCLLLAGFVVYCMFKHHPRKKNNSSSRV